MNDIMFEPRCPKCRDLGWIVIDDREYPCECQVNDTDYDLDRDLEEDYA